MIALLALFPLAALASPPPVPTLTETPCYKQVMTVLRTEYNDFKIVDGQKIGAEFISATDFTHLPVREYMGMNGDFHFGLVGYATISYHGDATTHTYSYIVAATCTYDADTKKYVVDDITLDGKITKEDLSLHSMDFER